MTKSVLLSQSTVAVATAATADHDPKTGTHLARQFIRATFVIISTIESVHFVAEHDNDSYTALKVHQPEVSKCFGNGCLCRNVRNICTRCRRFYKILIESEKIGIDVVAAMFESL